MTDSSKTSKILVIDDEESNVRLLAMSLRSDGYEIVTALSGEEGLNVFKETSPDLVLTDIKMPGMDGIEVLQRIKAMDASVEVIIITGHGDIDNAIEALKFGASDFINKPVRDKVLAVAIARAQEKRSIKRQLQAYTDNLEQRVAAATREITRQSNFLASLIRSSYEGIIATDQDLTVVVFNPGAEKILGYASAEMVQKRKITELLPERLHAFFNDRLPGRGYEQGWQEMVIRDKHQTAIPVNFYATPLFEEDKKIGTVSFLQDLRDIKRLEAELVRSERLAAIGQTVAGVAHGVKNILHGFKGGSYLVTLGIEKENKTKLRQGWDMIQRNISRTSDLVLDLLSYSKERSPECELCRPNAIVQDVCEVMRDLAESDHVRLTTDLDPNLGAVSIDPRTLHQCLTNLISNAIDACLFDEDTSKQWRVLVRTEHTRDGLIRLTVSDNGVGMTQEVKQKLFTSFFSTKGQRGTGLGLLVTRKLVEEHGGWISVVSKEGEGTTFTIDLPLCPESLSDPADNER